MAFILDQSGTNLFNIMGATNIFIALNNAICARIDGETKVLGMYSSQDRAEEEMAEIIQWMNDPDGLCVYKMGVI